jgi:hypothetical protein
VKLACHRGERHEYEEVERGIKLFSVSQIRKVAYDPFVGLPKSILEPARKRGSILHRRFAMALYATEGLCPHPGVIEEYRGYCLAQDEWIKKNDVRPVKVEQASGSLKYGYAGTPDGLVTYGSKRTLTLMDLKTGAKQVTDAGQLILYKEMDGYQDTSTLLDLYIHEDGTYTETFVKKSDRVTQWAWMMAALGVLTSRANFNVK